MESLRWIVILENTKHHPKFEEFVKFVKQGDKLKLLTDDPSKLKESFEVSKTIQSFNPSFNKPSGDRGILKFDVVKLLAK